ncbi:MAG: hypothetical protein IID40_03710 [Planctomycetes bacterium]|nr:hypothetical protein [Planctomycetota bacterium]
MSESKWAMPCPDCGKRIEWQGEFRERPACSHDATATVVDDDLMPPEAIARIEQCKRILDSVPNLPDRAEDFGLSVCEQVDSIREWIEANKHCTDALGNALDNVEQVVQKWLD